MAMTLGAFACILAMRRDGRHGRGHRRSRRPVAHQAGHGVRCSAMLMFSLAGIPPLAGFFAKFYVFLAAIEAGLYRARGHRRAGQRGRRLLLSAHRQDHVFRRAGRRLRAAADGACAPCSASPASFMLVLRADRRAARRRGRRRRAQPSSTMAFTLGSKAQRRPAIRLAAHDDGRLDQARGACACARRATRAALGRRRDADAGRGRRGRTWQTPAGNLAASLAAADPTCGSRRRDARLRRRAGASMRSTPIVPTVAQRSADGARPEASARAQMAERSAARRRQGRRHPARGERSIGGRRGGRSASASTCRASRADVPYPATSLARARIATRRRRRCFMALAEAWVDHAAAVERRPRLCGRSASAGWRARPGSAAPIAVNVGDDVVSRHVRDDRRRGPADRPRAATARASTISAGDVHFGDGGATPQAALMAADELVFVPLGGVGEIGMNLALYGYGRATRAQMARGRFRRHLRPRTTLPGVDLVLPDIALHRSGARQPRRHRHHARARGPFRRAARSLAAAAGAGLCMTPFTAALLEAKRQGEPDAPKIPVTIDPAGRALHRRPVRGRVRFRSPTRSPSRMRSPSARRSASSSTPATGSSIRTPVVGPPTDEARFRALGDEGVLALICNSTNAIREGDRRSEQARSATASSGSSPRRQGRVAVTTFASNVARIRSVAEAARDAGRECRGARPRDAPRRSRWRANSATWTGCRRFPRPGGLTAICRATRSCVICTGSQGEPRAALAASPTRRASRCRADGRATS